MDEQNGATSPAPSESEGEKIEEPKKEKGNGKIKMAKNVVFSFLNRAALVFLGYAVAYLEWSLLLPFITVSSLVWLENQKTDKYNKIKGKAIASSLDKKQLIDKLEQLPSWVTFPDRERAEWLNDIILQLWPSVCHYVVKKFRGSIQTKIRKKFDSFRFEDIDFGITPPKIDGVKVYNKSVTKDSIIIDFDVFYDGDCDINFSMSGVNAGRIKDFQLGVEVRVVLKPILVRMPIVGGVQVFFLNTPDINFELDGISSIPGFSYFLHQKIEQIIRKKIVFPNKIAKRFTKTVEASELKSLEPEGVLRVHVFEAKDLERKDVTGKSDPYVVLNVGAQECKTQVIKRSLNPKWDYWCEFAILDPLAQQLHFTLYDQDDLNEDDFLGSGAVEIGSVIKEGENDIWIDLNEVKHGKIHLRFTWLALSSDYNCLEAASQEVRLLEVAHISTAILCVYIDSAQNLPICKSVKKPDVYLILTVGNNQQKSRVRKRTTDPVWEQGFIMLVRNPENESLIITIHDKHTDNKIDQFVYNIQQLKSKENMQISKEEFALPKSGPNSKIILSLQLRVLTNALFEAEDDSDSAPEESLSRNGSTRSNKSTNSPVSSVNVSHQTSLVEDFAEEAVAHKVTSTPVIRAHNLERSPSIRSVTKEKDLGRIELTIGYSELRQKLIVTVHKIANLPLKDPSNIPDPYVKLKLISPGNNHVKNKTKVIMDNCDPEFDETFEYLLSVSEIKDHRLILTVKTYRKLSFSKNVMGQVIVNLNQINLEEPYKRWFDLGHQEVPD